MGTASKLKDIILDSLPTGVTLKVLTYDYATLIKQQVMDMLYHHIKSYVF